MAEASLRERATAVAAELELPTYKGVPGWEFTPIEGLDLEAFPVREGADEPAAFAFEDAVRPSADRPTTEGPVVMPLARAEELLGDVVEKHLGSLVGADTPFTARNAAQWTDGVLVYVPRNEVVEAPIVVSTVHGEEGSALHWRLLVVLEEGAQAEVWHESRTSHDGEALLNGAVELVVGQNARLQFVDLQEVNERAWIFGTQRGRVERDGTLDWISLGFGSRNGKVFQEARLEGPGAHGRVTGAYATRGRQHVDFDTLQVHAAPDCTSDLAFRGILSGRSTGVWRGMIRVDEGAQRTDAFQESRNLLLGKRAHADAIPGLEILANDVRCTHAAAVAQIDPDQLFYLRARGLDDAVARRLVIEGFLAELVERFDEGRVREHVGAALERRLGEILD